MSCAKWPQHLASSSVNYPAAAGTGSRDARAASGLGMVLGMVCVPTCCQVRGWTGSTPSAGAGLHPDLPFLPVFSSTTSSFIPVAPAGVNSLRRTSSFVCVFPAGTQHGPGQTRGLAEEQICSRLQ